ncbi:MAG: flavodoxin family protein [Deltaproteobacteria bacterium]|nr:flavodoxin family protein [Deltaproteobacteria bacterium]
MKITSVLGSPRVKKGNTAKALGWVEEELVAKGHQIERINVAERKLKGCIECYTCQGIPDEPGCPQKDDAVAIFERFRASDVLLYASPLFCWGYSAQIKPLIDRHFCLITGYGTRKWKSLIAGKRAGLLVTCAGPVEGNAELLLEMFKRLMDYSKCKIADTLVIPFTTTADAMGEDIRKEAVKFAHTLAGKP